MAEETELDVLKDIRTNTSTTAARVNTTNTKLDTIIADLTELRGQVIDVRNKVSDVKVVRLYVGRNPVNETVEIHAKKTEKEFTELYNGGYRVIATLGSDEEWATLIMGKYPAPNKAK